MSDRKGNDKSVDLDIGTLSGHLWEAANILRGPVDAADFKHTSSRFFFFKQISNVYDEEYAEALEESDGDENLMLNKLYGQEKNLTTSSITRMNLFLHCAEDFRRRAQSFLTDDHIQRIVAAYQTFGDEDGFARVVGNDEIREKGGNLSIPLYVRADNGNGDGGRATETISLKQAIANWQESSRNLRSSMEDLLSQLKFY